MYVNQDGLWFPVAPSFQTSVLSGMVALLEMELSARRCGSQCMCFSVLAPTSLMVWSRAPLSELPAASGTHLRPAAGRRRHRFVVQLDKVIIARHGFVLSLGTEFPR